MYNDLRWEIPKAQGYLSLLECFLGSHVANIRNYLLATKLFGKAGDIKAFVELNFYKDNRVEDEKLIKLLIQPEYRALLWKNPELTLSLTIELYVQGNIMLHMQYMKRPTKLYSLHTA